MIAFAESVADQAAAHGDFTWPIVVALVFSALGLLASVAALSWNVLSFILSGGRARVELRIAEIVPYAGVSGVKTNSSGRRIADVSGTGMLRRGMELAQVTIENPGRLAFTLTDVGLELKGTSAPYSVTPRLFKLENHGAQNSQMETFHRLEPFGRVTFLMDFWSEIDRNERADPNGTVSIRAFVRVAGRRRIRRSRRRLRWELQPGEVSSRSDPHRIDAEDIVLREVMRLGWHDTLFRYPLDVSFAAQVAELINPRQTKGEIQQVLEAKSLIFVGTNLAPLGLLAFNIHRAIGAYSDQVVFPAETPGT